MGVEPTLPCGKPDFESGAFGHSAISPLEAETYALDAAERQVPGRAADEHIEIRLTGPKSCH